MVCLITPASTRAWTINFMTWVGLDFELNHVELGSSTLLESRPQLAEVCCQWVHVQFALSFSLQLFLFREFGESVGIGNPRNNLAFRVTHFLSWRIKTMFNKMNKINKMKHSVRLGTNIIVQFILKVHLLLSHISHISMMPYLEITFIGNIMILIRDKFITWIK